MENVATPVGYKRPVAIRLPDFAGFFRVFGHRRSLFGLAIIAPFIFVAVAASYLPLQDPLETHPQQSLQAPSVSHPLGTDKIGRDVLSRVTAGAKTSIF